MSEGEFDTLKSIFRMMAPADLIGVQKNVVGLTEKNKSVDGIKRLLQILHDPDGGGAIPTSDMLKAYNDAVLGGNSSTETSAAQKDFLSAVRFYALVAGNTTVPAPPGITWHKNGFDFKKNASVPFKFDSLVLPANLYKLKTISSAIILSNSNFIHPSRHQIQNAELFMNFIPTIVMSRCVPYLDATFILDGSSFQDDGLSRPGLLRFLLGGGNKNVSEQDKAMLDANIINAEGKVKSQMGMEVFTSPQTLVNPDPQLNKNRYNAVIDPFRPLASIESFTVNVQSTFGWASNKTANLVLKLHDRSRMAELAEFIRPAAYPRTKINIEWGWKHPDEPNNPYANLINGTMRQSEVFDVKNTSYNFDNVGQVQINLQLAFKGQRAMNEIVLGDVGTIFAEVQRLADEIVKLRKDLGLDGDTGISKDVQGFHLIEAGSRGQLPTLPPGKTDKELVNLQETLKKGQFDSAGSEKLIKALRKLYITEQRTDGSSAQSFRTQVDNSYSSAIGQLFNRWVSGPDPFLMTSLAGGKGPAQVRINEMGADSLPSTKFPEFVKSIDDANVVTLNKWEKKTGVKQTIASFGKIFVSTMLQTAMKSGGISDDFQFYFYRVNDLAGPASGINLAEFPIDLQKLKTDFTEHVSRSRTDRITAMDFINLLVNSQLRDVFSSAYGLGDYKAQFDPKNKNSKAKSKKKYKSKKGKEEFESVSALKRSKLGPFKPPVIELMIEHLTTSNIAQPEDTSAQASLQNKTNGIIRFHVYDKNVNLYPQATMLLKAGDDPSSDRFYASIETLNALRKRQLKEDIPLKRILEILGIAPGKGMNYKIAGGSAEATEFGYGNQVKIKELVAATTPTIIIGGNASNVLTANLASDNNSLVATTLLRQGFAGKGGVMTAAGSGVGNLPLKVIPANMTMTTLGCPLFRPNQRWFIDFNTGTNVDTIYNMTQLTHNLAPGKFESSATFTYWDSYASFESPPTIMEALGKIVVPKTDVEEKKKKK